MKLIPAFIHRRIEHRPNLAKIISNIGWLFIDKILRMAVGLFVSVWLARYLGPAQFGVLNYAIALVALFAAISTLGLNAIVVRDIVQFPETAHTTLGTAFVLQFLGALIALGMILGTIAWLQPDDELAKLIVAILGVSLVFKSSSVIKYWFESQLQSRYTVWVENGVLLIIAAAKVGMIMNDAPLVAFVWLMLFESVLVAAGLFGIYVKKTRTLRIWHASFERGAILLRESWPLMVAGIAYMVYMRIDQIMLGEMIGSTAVGIYSAALRVSEVWAAIATIFVSSLFPTIIESHKQSEVIFKRRVQRLLNLLFQFALVIAFVVTLSADWIIQALFGPNYTEAATVLRVHIWAGIFVFMGHVGGKWYIIKSLQRLTMQRSIVGLVMNVVLNALLIPNYGAVGAAIGSLATMFIVFYAYDAMNKVTRDLFLMKTNSILLFKKVS